MQSKRRNWLKQIGLAMAGITVTQFKTAASPAQGILKNFINKLYGQSTKHINNMKLGAFSVSLNVKDLTVSREFYENLGFTVFAGDKKHYVIMKNGNALIGLFQGMFEKNILTFNPGWDENAANVSPFDDVREIQHQLKVKGIKLETEADETTSGPAGFILLDPDGNSILIDQHV